MTKFDQDGFQVECGLRLHQYRHVHGLTQHEFGKRVGISRATIANIERGRQRVAADVLWRASIVLNVPIWRLMPERA